MKWEPCPCRGCPKDNHKCGSDNGKAGCRKFQKWAGKKFRMVKNLFREYIRNRPFIYYAPYELDKRVQVND